MLSSHGWRHLKSYLRFLVSESHSSYYKGKVKKEHLTFHFWGIKNWLTIRASGLGDEYAFSTRVSIGVGA